MIIKKGIATSSGIAIGKCYLVDRNNVFIKGYEIDNIDNEVNKLKAAVSYTSGVIEKLQYSNIAGKINTELYDAYKLLLEDELFIGEAEHIIKSEKINAEYALKKVRDNIINTMMESDNEYLRDRVYDIEHIYQRIQRHMSNLKYDEFDDAKSDSIIISHDLTAADMNTIIKKDIKGFATDTGGKTSHNAIVAKSSGIVSVMGLSDIYKDVKNGDTIIIDGFLGQVVINPDNKTLLSYESKMDEYNKFLSSFKQVKDTRCFTKDNKEVELYGNIENNGEITLLDVHGLKGVGLYRTEFFYINNGSMSEEEQYKIYSDAVSMMKGKPLIIRSFDLGGDKISRYMPHPEEENPVMGLRAIRYSLKYQSYFRTQIRAILRVAAKGDIRLLLPMVSSVDELIEAKQIIDAECDILKSKNIEHNPNVSIGIMIELPSAALRIDKFFQYADFFSIGTNDLIQYFLGIDRNNDNVSHIYSPLHPAIITILKNISDLSNKYNKNISICGEIAGDCRYIPILLGLGYKSFSMNPRASYIVRKVISMLDSKECIKVVDDVLNASTVSEAEKLLNDFNQEKVNNIYM